MHRAHNSLPTLDASLVDALLQPDAFSHPVANVELIETHISWLVIAGDYAYKIKKPIVLDFLDFGSLESRKFFCEEEIRLNKPWAPDIYIDVIPITITDGTPRFGGNGEIVEYAVWMCRFDQVMRLDHQLEDNSLSIEDMKELARNIATRHDAAEKVEAGQRSRVLRLTGEFMSDNFSALEGNLTEEVLAPLQAWTKKQLKRNSALLKQRFDAGFCRDCHGDLHLGNLVRLPDGITTFDCIEFNTDLRHIDVMCDIAFLVMDLSARGRADLAAHFLNRYLEVTGDYEGVAVLDLFFVYRCLVRAKVSVIRSLEQRDAGKADSDLATALFYGDLASRQVAERTPKLVVMHGFSGSGKTWVSGRLMAGLSAIRVRSDIERKREFGLSEAESSHSAVGGGIYSGDANRQAYARLFELARILLDAGYSVILDASFLDLKYREKALSVAEACGCPAVIVDVYASEDVMHRRLEQRQSDHAEQSEAGISVLTYQLSTADSLTSVERRLTVECDNSNDVDIPALIDRVKECNRFP